ncbi:MAG: DUF6305 family protein [Desulfobacterales bacterium]|nr:DUF6305 family protein [Desulfobacterales bacterium]
MTELNTQNVRKIFKTQMFLVFAALVGLMIALPAQAQAAPIVLTPFGQSPDATMVKVVLKKAKVKGRLDKMLQGSGLNDEKALIVVVGGSSKGMGAAGIKKDEEIERVKNLIAAARDKGIKILVMHIGGKGRRGKLSDQFITEAMPLADKIIIVEGSDHDGLISNLVKEKGIEILTAPGVRGCTEPLKVVLTQWGII